MEISNSEIANNEAEQRFESHVQGHIAFLSYLRFPDRFVIVHTEVPPALEGKGFAGKLVATALDFARAAGRVIPQFFTKWLHSNITIFSRRKTARRFWPPNHMRKTPTRSVRRRSD